MKRIHTTPDTTIFIGDQIFTDIYGANRAGIRTYLCLLYTSSNGLISPIELCLGSGDVVIFKKCSRNVSTPKFVSAEPKNTGEISPLLTLS